MERPVSSGDHRAGPLRVAGQLAFADAQVSMLCLYDTRRLGSEILTIARHTHPDLVTAQGTRPNPDYVDSEA